MQIDHLKEKCQREGCDCDVEAGQTYCSEDCKHAAELSARADATADDGCDCGHAECAVK